MALKQVLLTRKIAEKTKLLEEARAKDAGFLERRTALDTRADELEAAVLEITADTPAEEVQVIEDEVADHEAAEKTLADEVAANDGEKTRLSDEIAKLQAELDEVNSRAKVLPAPTHTPQADPEERKDEPYMQNRTKFFGMTREERDQFIARDDIKTFLTDVRAVKRGVTNGALLVPEIVLETLRNNMEEYSKLIKFVSLKRVPGTARQTIVGAAPEGVWMEAEGELNELSMSFNQIEVDGYMVGGVIYVHNNLLKDSDFALASEIMSQLGKAIGKAVDRAILFGTGTNMPVGIVTRLAQTTAPANWGTYAPTWTDLHTTNIKKLNIDGTTGATFFASLVAALGVAKPDYTDGRAFWVMNRATHIKIMAKALAFDAAAALLAGVNNQMPIVGGEIVVDELVESNTIIGGYGSGYLLAEREGATMESSEHYRFVQNQTTFKGYSRYDGMPVFGEAFVVVNFANADATTSSTFPTDWANTDIGVLGVTAAASASASGKTVLTVSGTENSGTTLAYKIGDFTIKAGQTLSGYTALTSGTTEITAAAGKTITVVELNGDDLAIKVGKVKSVPKA
jgi:HK97 family phage major capsid protein